MLRTLEVQVILTYKKAISLQRLGIAELRDVPGGEAVAPRGNLHALLGAVLGSAGQDHLLGRNRVWRTLHGHQDEGFVHLLLVGVPLRPSPLGVDGAAGAGEVHQDRTASSGAAAHVGGDVHGKPAPVQGMGTEGQWEAEHFE